MTKLDPRIEEIRKKFNLSASDFWELPQKKGTWIVKHAALETVAVQSKIEFMPPQILEANGANGVCALVVEGRTPEGVSEWSTGEASPKNNKNAYPWAMSEKRAKDRVILKLAGLHGLLYSEEEAADFKQPDTFEEAEPPAPESKPFEGEANFRRSKADARELYIRLQKDVKDATTQDELTRLMKSADMVADLASLPKDWEKIVRSDASIAYRAFNTAKLPQDSLDELEISGDMQEAMRNLSAG